MKKIVLALLLSISVAHAQSVQQSGSVTPNHAARWISNGVIGDGGTAASPVLTSLGTVGQGPTICASSGPVTGPYNRLCLSANTSSAGQITLNNYGGAVAQPLQLCVNNNCLTIPTSGGSTTVPTIITPTITNALICASDILGDLKNCTAQTQYGVPYYSGTQTLTSTAAMTDGQIIVGQTSSAPLPKTLSGDVTSISAAGAVTIGKVNSVVFPASPTVGTVPYVSSSNTITYGIAPVTGGGTGAASFTANLPLLGNGTGAIAQGTISGNTTKFGTTNGTLTNGHCVSIDSAGNFVDAGGTCTTGGGGGTVASGTAGQTPTYASSGTTVTGSNIIASATTYPYAVRPVNVATTGSNITLSGDQTIDGITLSDLPCWAGVTCRVLVKDQTTGSENGCYTAASGAWSRCADAAVTGQIVHGTKVFVQSRSDNSNPQGGGAVNGGGTFYVATQNPITIGTTSIAFSYVVPAQAALGGGLARSKTFMYYGVEPWATQGSHDLLVQSTGTQNVLRNATMTSWNHYKFLTGDVGSAAPYNIGIASFTGSISSTTLTAGAPSAGTIQLWSRITDAQNFPTNAPTSAGNPTLHFASPPGASAGMIVEDLTNPKAITGNLRVLSTSGNDVTLTGNITAPNVSSGDTIAFSTVARGTQIIGYGTQNILTNGTTASGNATLHFASTAGVEAGMKIKNITAANGVIPFGTTVLSKTSTTVVMSANAGASPSTIGSYSYNSGTGVVTLALTGVALSVVTGSTVTIASLNIAGLNGTYALASVSGAIITYTGPTGQAGSPSGGGTLTPTVGSGDTIIFTTNGGAGTYTVNIDQTVSSETMQSAGGWGADGIYIIPVAAAGDDRVNCALNSPVQNNGFTPNGGMQCTALTDLDDLIIRFPLDYVDANRVQCPLFAGGVQICVGSDIIEQPLTFQILVDFNSVDSGRAPPSIDTRIPCPVATGHCNDNWANATTDMVSITMPTCYFLGSPNTCSYAVSWLPLGVSGGLEVNYHCGAIKSGESCNVYEFELKQTPGATCNGGNPFSPPDDATWPTGCMQLNAGPVEIPEVVADLHHNARFSQLIGKGLDQFNPHFTETTSAFAISPSSVLATFPLYESIRCNTWATGSGKSAASCPMPNVYFNWRRDEQDFAFSAASGDYKPVNVQPSRIGINSIQFNATIPGLTAGEPGYIHIGDHNSSDGSDMILLDSSLIGD